MVGGKITGTSSQATDDLAKEEARLRDAARDALLDFYTAPTGPSGDAQRAAADDQAKRAWDGERKRREQGEGVKSIQADAQGWKADFTVWMKALR